jgi:hypothetical protein
MRLKEMLTMSVLIPTSMLAEEPSQLYDLKLSICNSENELHSQINTLKEEIKNPFLNGMIDFQLEDEKYIVFLNVNAHEETILEVYKELNNIYGTEIIKDIEIGEKDEPRNSTVTIKVMTGIDALIKIYCTSDTKKFKKVKNKILGENDRIYSGQYLSLPKEIIREELLPQEEK